MGVTNPTHSTRPRSRLYSDISQPDTPVIYTGAFPILTAQPGRGSIYNKISATHTRNCQQKRDIKPQGKTVKVFEFLLMNVSFEFMSNAFFAIGLK